MKNGSFYFLLVLISFSCSTTPEIEKGTFPDNLVVKKTKQHQRVLGTDLFAIIPSNYKYTKPLRYVKSEDEFIIISKFSTAYDKINRKNALENLGPGVKTILFKELNFNNKKVFFVESVNVAKNEHAYILDFGDDQYSTLIMAQSKADNPETRYEMLEIIMSICEDNSIVFDPLETTFFTFDKNITNFKLAKSLGYDFRYTIDGKYEDSKYNNKVVNSILLNEIGLTNYEQRTKLMKQWTDSYLKVVPNAEGKRWSEKKLGPYDVFEFETNISFNEANGKVYFAILSDDQNRTMKFTGIAFDEIENHLKKYKETVQSIKFK